MAKELMNVKLDKKETLQTEMKAERNIFTNSWNREPMDYVEISRGV